MISVSVIIGFTIGNFFTSLLQIRIMKELLRSVFIRLLQ